MAAFIMRVLDLLAYIPVKAWFAWAFIVAWIIALAGGFSGCSSTPVIKTVTVEVKVPVHCDKPVIPKPILSFSDGATLGLDLSQKVALLIAEDLSLKAYTTRLEAAVEGCVFKEQK